MTRCRHRRCVGLRSQRLCVFGLRWDRTSQLGKRGSLMRQRGQGHGLPAGGAPGLGGAVEPRFPPSVRPAWRAVPVRGRARGVCLLRFFVLALCRGVFFHSLRRRLIDPWRALYHCGPLLRGSSEDCRGLGPTVWAAALCRGASRPALAPGTRRSSMQGFGPRESLTAFSDPEKEPSARHRCAAVSQGGGGAGWPRPRALAPRPCGNASGSSGPEGALLRSHAFPDFAVLNRSVPNRKADQSNYL